MSRIYSLLTYLLAAGVLSAAPVPKAPPEPLPKGATARLGSLAFRKPPQSYGIWYSSDGATIYAREGDTLIGWDATTGRRLDRGPFPLGHKIVGREPLFAGDRLITFDEVYDAQTRRFSGRTAVVTGPDGKVISRVDCSSQALGNVWPTAASGFAASRDGTRAAHVGDNRTVRAFDLTTGKEIFKQQIGTGRLAGAVMAPDGKTLFVQEVTKDVRRFSLPDGKELPPLSVSEGALSTLVVSADGTRAASQMSVWQKTPSGGKALTVENCVVVHDLATGKVVGNIEPGGRPYCGPMIGSDAILVGSNTIRPPAPRTSSLARWNLKTLKKEWEIPGGGAAVVSQDGKRLVLSSEASVRVFDAATGKRLDATVAHPHPLDRVEFSADGQMVTTRCSAAVMTWSLGGERKSAADGPDLWDGRGDGPRRDSPRAWFEIGTDGTTVELAGGHFDRRKDAWRMPLGAEIPERLLTLDGKRVIGAVFDAKQALWEVTVYDGPAGKRAATWTVAARAGARNHPAMVLSGDGKTLFGFDGDVVGRDPDTGKETVRVKTGPLTPSGGSAFPHPLASSSDGSRIAIVQEGRGKTVRVFEAKTGKELAAHDIGTAYSPEIAFDPRGTRVAVRVGPAVLVCDAEGAAEPRKLVDRSSPATCMAFSPNGADLAVGYLDGTALIWDLTAK